MSYLGHLPEIGAGIINKAVTATLYVSPNGSNSNGKTWASAFTTIQAALAAASTDVNECTLILIGINTGANNYNIDTTGDPTFTGNYILKGSHRTWAKIKNEHASATSILKFTGYVSLIDLNFNLGVSNNGIIITKGAFRVEHCQFVGGELTSAKIALYIDAATSAKHGKVVDCHFLGEGLSYMTAIKLDGVMNSNFEKLRMHSCQTCIQIVNVISDNNLFHKIDMSECDLGLNLDAGNGQHFDTLLFRNINLNIDDDVKDHIWDNIIGEFGIYIIPDNFTGVQIVTGGAGDTWGSDTEIIAADSISNPFRIVAIHIEGDANEKFRVRFSANSGSPWYDETMIEGDVNKTKREVSAAPSGTEYIFNKGTRISASSKSESGGNNIYVWVEIQEI